MDKGRFDAFTDGVFAVAITLMVLEIHVPELKRGTNAEMREFIGGTFFYAAGTLIAFFAPKVSIAIFVGITIYYSLPGLFNLRRHLPVDAAPK